MEEIKTVTYQCPNCNAALEFDNESGKFRCFYCDSVFDEADIKRIFTENEQMKLDKNEPKPTEQQAEDESFSGQSALYSCPNCGAGVICGELTSSTRCHFCHTPVILSGRLSGEYKPDMIIPFATTREHAESSFREYIKGKFLLPGGFKSDAQIKNITALYVPYWLKSGLTTASLDAKGKIIRTWRTGDVVHTNTKVFQVAREAEMVFIRVPCDGSKRIDDSLMESIEPFNYTGLKPFSMSYLSGCAAEKYDVDKAEATQRIDRRIKEAAGQVLKESAKQYSALEDVKINTAFRSQTYVYTLLPVWFLNYTYKGKDYAFAMNGQTGTIFGQLPISAPKAILLAAGVFVGVTTALFLLGGACFGW